MAEEKPKAVLPPQSGKETGSSGTYFFKGYITAEEYSIDLQGKYGLQVYDVMRKSDATVHAALMVCKNPILGAEWSIESASNEPADQEIAKRANYEFFNRSISYPDVMREGFSFLEFGFFVGELVFEAAEYDGKPYIGIKKIAARKQRSILKWETDDGKPGISQILPTGKDGSGLVASTANIPRNKLLYVANDQEGENYFGFSILRYAYKPWKIKDALEIMNAVALENMALGIPFIKKGIDGASVDPQELENLRKRLREQRVNEEAFLEYPASMEVGWTDMKSQTTKDVLPTIEYQDRQILLSVLAQFLLLGSADSAGSRAVSQDHSRLFVKALTAVARQWQLAFQRDVINSWVDLNYSTLPNGYPKLIFSTISDEDVKEISTAVSTLMTAGALTADRDVENRLRKLLNLPQLAEEDYDNYTKDTKLSTPEEAAQKMKDQQDAMKKAGVTPPPQPGDSKTAGANPKDPNAQDQQLPADDPNEPIEAVREARKVQKRLIDIIVRQ